MSKTKKRIIDPRYTVKSTRNKVNSLSFGKFQNDYSTIISLQKIVFPSLDVAFVALRLYSNAFNLPSFSVDPYFAKGFDIEPWFYDYDQEWLIHKARQLKIESTLNYFKKETKVITDVLDIPRIKDQLDVLFDFNRRSFKFQPLLNRDDILKYIWLSTASGCPLFKKKGEVFQETYSLKDLHFVDHIINLLDSPAGVNCLKNSIITIGWRVQMRMSGIKLRQIYIMPLQILILEIIVFQSLLSHFDQNLDSVYSKTDVFNDLSKRFYRFDQVVGAKYNFSADYEKMDLNMSQYTINLQFDWMKDKIEMSNPIVERAFEIVRFVHLEGHICSLDESGPAIFKKSNGLISGSLLTNFLGTANSALNLQAFYNNDSSLITAGRKLSIENCVLKGDDSIIRETSDFSMEKFSRFCFQVFGMKIPITKIEEMVSHKDVPIHFLGAKMDKEARYSNKELMTRQLSLSENFISLENMSHFERRVSKIISLTSKYSDTSTWRTNLFKKVCEDHKQDLPRDFYLLRKELNVIPDNTQRIQDSYKKLNIEKFLADGWRTQ